MLTFYSHPISGNARRVWIALLEKQVPFETIGLNLDGDQFSSEFMSVNPLQRIPAIVDDGFRVVESLAILDYLEAKYPHPSLMPLTPEAIAAVRMAEMVTISDLQPMMTTLQQHVMGMPVDDKKLAAAQARIQVVLNYLEHHLIVGSPYFIGDVFTLADIVAGTMVLVLPYFGVDLEAYPKIQTWLNTLAQRPSWQATAPPADALEKAKSRVEQIMKDRGDM